MNSIPRTWLYLLPFVLWGFPLTATALPGQTADEVAAWIRANPTLRPTSGERLLVRKTDTPNRRFMFQASVLSPGIATSPLDHTIIINERIELFDAISGVTRERLEETLRSIYGADIYQDYQQAQVAYAYPTFSTITQARSQSTPLKEELRGELRVGNRFAYWVEVAQPRTERPISGRMMVFLKSDLDKLETELRNR